jgi:hypothetical protein
MLMIQRTTYALVPLAKEYFQDIRPATRPNLPPVRIAEASTRSAATTRRTPCLNTPCLEQSPLQQQGRKGE